jgi:hypothetical protein
MQAEAVLKLLGLLLISACSYHIKKNEAVLKLPSQERIGDPRIYIPIFDNNTVYPGAEVYFTSELRDTLAKVHGLRVVHREEDANLFLLGEVSRYHRKRSSTSVTGTGDSQRLGGLAEGELAADGIHLEMTIDLKMLYVRPDTRLREQLWLRKYDQQVVFPASTRFEISKGSTSAPYINDAREKIQLKILARQFSRQVIDQVVQDF